MRAYVVHHRRVAPDLADDLLNSFVVDRILERKLVRRADRGRGRFRSFLVKSLDRFVTNHWRSARAAKRSPAGGGTGGTGGTGAHVTLDEVPDPAAAPSPPGQAFDLEWARQVVDDTLAVMRAQCTASGRAYVWDVFEGRVLRPTLFGDEPVAYASLVERHNFASPSQASNVLITANRTFARCLRTVIGAYERDPAAVEREILDLRRVFSAAGAGRTCPPFSNVGGAHGGEDRRRPGEVASDADR